VSKGETLLPRREWKCCGALPAVVQSAEFCPMLVRTRWKYSLGAGR